MQPERRELRALERELEMFIFRKSSNFYKYFKYFKVLYKDKNIFITGRYYSCVVTYRILANGKKEWLDYKIVKN